MTANTTWDDLVHVVRNLKNREYGPPIKGCFYIAAQEDLAAIKSCLSSESDTNFRLVNLDDQALLEVGQIIEIEVSPRLGFGLLTPNLNTLLFAQYARIKQPHRYFLLDNSVNYTDPVSSDHLIARYRNVLEFIQILKRVAAFLDPDEPALVLINNGKFDIPIIYNASDLINLSISDLADIINILPQGTHEKNCGAILAEAVINMTMHLPTHERFQFLLAHLKELKRRYEDGYKIFSSGFSYEKIRDQTESARVEYIGKIHKTFSDIQNQLLSIPVATIVVATQMKDSKNLGYEFWVNSSVLAGCWIFAILMIFLLHNQSLTLSVLNDEINRQKRQFENEFALVANNFSDTFRYLSRRALAQRIIIWTIDFFVVFGLALSHIIYIKLTSPARDFIVNLIPCMTQFL